MDAQMHIENGKLVFGRRACSNCWGAGLVAKKIACPVCEGTGRGKRGGKNGCRACNGFGTAYDHVNKVTCPSCNGVNPETAEQADRYDYMPDAMFQALEFRVIRTTNRQTWEQAYLGLGTVFSCTDYGQHTRMSDDELIAKVRTHTGVQACKVSKEDGTLADYVAIITNDNGYTVVAVYGK